MAGVAPDAEMIHFDSKTSTPRPGLEVEGPDRDVQAPRAARLAMAGNATATDPTSRFVQDSFARRIVS